MDELKRNGSGYYDETAYKAIKRIEGAMRGEIYEYTLSNNEIRKVLVVSSNERAQDNIFNFIMLVDELPAGAIGAQIICGTKMHANCERVTYGYKNRMGNYIRTATESEMRAVDAAMLKALELEACNAPTEVNDECERLKERLYNAEKRVLELTHENHQLSEGNGFRDISEREVNLLIERNKLETERDLYKSLFETLQERMLGK